MTKQMDMETKRAMILKACNVITDDGMNYGSLARLKMNILEIMRWTNDSAKKTNLTVANMVEKGIIEISASGKGFKMLTKREARDRRMARQ